MKKKELAELVEEVNGCKKTIDVLGNRLYEALNKYESLSKEYIDLVKGYRNDTRIIDTLITQNFVDNTKYAAVVLIPYRGKPTFVKDGKVIAKDSSEVTMTWDAYEHSVGFSTENM